MAAVINEISDPNDYPIIYYWRNDDCKYPIEIDDRLNKGVMYNIYNREKDCFEMRINSYTFNRHIFEKNRDLRKIQFTKAAQPIYIDNYAFQYSIVEEVDFEGVGVIGSSFIGCHNLKKIRVPECVERIGSNAFASCGNLRKVVIEGAPLLGKFCFIGTPVGNREYFGKCLYKAKDINEPYQTYNVKPGTKSIAAGAFSETVNIGKVIVPNSVLKVGYDAFETSSVSDVVFEGCPKFIYVKDETASNSIFGNSSECAEIIVLYDERLLPTIQLDDIYQYVQIVCVMHLDGDGNIVIKK